MVQSILKVQDMMPVILADYDLDDPVQCRFIRRGANDHYHVQAKDRNYVLRVYLNDKYYIQGADDFRFELALLDFLADDGLPVASPIRRVDGDFLGVIESPEGVRYFALFPKALGQVFDDYPDRRTLDLGRQLGAITARFHIRADDFVSQHDRYHLDLHYLIDEPLRIFETYLIQNGLGDLGFFRPFAEEIKREINRLDKTAGVYGIVHGDLHRWNMHYHQEAGFCIYDFDHCAYGWRIYDVCAIGQALQNSFIEGYESVRRLSDLEKALLALFIKAREIWDVGDYLALRPVRGRGEPDVASLKEDLGRFRNLMTDCST